ncbi:elongator complex protein 5 isoform X2 [Peromyscus maniculatus bairdii]|uniref:elongator complex protein 5 isoform X2 n=1 Tax=Peromyscus maniculatus bairdii TaxID=230844 RepID=UPI003FD0B000
MLDSLLALGGLVLLRDSVEWEGRSLLKALIKKSALRGEQIHVLGCEVSEEEFREGFGSDINSRLVYHDLFKDPLNWSKPGEAVPEGPLGTLRAMCRRTDPGPVTIALDSLSWLLLHLPCVTLCQTLHALSQPRVSPGADSPIEQVRVLGLLHEELHGPGPMGALSTLAHTEVTLSGKMGQTSASILCRRPQQRATYQNVWQFPLRSRNLKDHFAKQSSVVTFLWVLHVQLIKQSRQEQFLAQMAVFAKKKINSI